MLWTELYPQKILYGRASALLGLSNIVNLIQNMLTDILRIMCDQIKYLGIHDPLKLMHKINNYI